MNSATKVSSTGHGEAQGPPPLSELSQDFEKGEKGGFHQRKHTNRTLDSHKSGKLLVQAGRRFYASEGKACLCQVRATLPPLFGGGRHSGDPRHPRNLPRCRCATSNFKLRAFRLQSLRAQKWLGVAGQYGQSRSVFWAAWVVVFAVSSLSSWPSADGIQSISYASSKELTKVRCRLA